MKRFDTILLIMLLGMASMMGCKKVTIGKNSGRSAAPGGGAVSAADGEVDAEESAALLESSASDMESEMAAEEEADAAEGGGDAEGEEVASDEAAEKTSEERFNLVKFMKTKPKLAPYYKYIDPSNTMFTMGDQKMFKIETNGTFGVSPDFAKAETERKLMGAYWLKAYAANKLLTNAENETGLFIDLGAEAVLDKLNIDMHFRYIGVDVASRSVMAGFDQSVTRDFEVGAKVIPLVDASIYIGGEVGLRAEFGVRRDNVLNMIYTPRANINSGAEVGVSVVVVSGHVVGSVRIIDLAMKGAANLGIVKEAKLLYFDIGLDKGDVKLVDGKIQLVGKSFGIEIGKTDIWNPTPLASIPLPTYGTSMIKFLKKPADAAACKTATDIAAVKLAGNVKKIQDYVDEAPDEDKPAVKGGIGRAGLIYRQIQAYCSR